MIFIDMKPNKVKKQCKICRSTFEVIKSREHTAKYCKRDCYDIAQTKKVPWNKGKKWEELYGNDRAEEMKHLIRTYAIGENNPMFGKHHSKASKEKMSIAKNEYVPWNNGKKYPGIFSHINRLGENNAYIKHILRNEGITYDQYKSRLSDKERYYRAVMSITKLQNISDL